MVECYTEQEEETLIATILDIGETLLTSGAEVNRVEDTIRRIGAAYEFKKMDIFTITNLMVLTAHTRTGKVITQTRRITSTCVDLEKVARTNDLSRKVCVHPIPVESLREKVSDIKHNSRSYGHGVRLFAYIITAASFTVFFGGDLVDGLSSAITSMILFVAVTLGQKLRIQPIIANLVSAFIMTLVITGLIKTGVGTSFDTIIMGNIMLLIPGINLTTSIRDIILGDTVSGLMGMCDALLKAFGIAVGCVSGMLLTGMF